MRPAPEPTRTRPTRRHLRRIGGAVAVTVLAVGIPACQRPGEPATPGGSTRISVPDTHAAISAPSTPSASWASGFSALQAKLGGRVQVALEAIGSSEDQVLLGGWADGPAWSTIKVPLVIAALRQQGKSADITAEMTAAVTESDNAAAESIWASLGDPVTAARKVQDVLRNYGDQHTDVQSTKIRPEFTAFGQTLWSLNEQLRFLSGAYCDPANKAVFALMGEIENAQKWGLGKLPGAKFKGGWGPDPGGHYLVRQIGVIVTSNGSTAVAVATDPPSGTLDDGIQALNTVAQWLGDHEADLPAGTCLDVTGR